MGILFNNFCFVLGMPFDIKLHLLLWVLVKKSFQDQIYNNLIFKLFRLLMTRKSKVELRIQVCDRGLA